MLSAEAQPPRLWASQGSITRPAMCWWPWSSSPLTSPKASTWTEKRRTWEPATRWVAGRSPAGCPHADEANAVGDAAGFDVWLRHRRDRGVHASHYHPGSQAQRQDGRDAQKWDASVAPPRLQDSGQVGRCVRASP